MSSLCKLQLELVQKQVLKAVRDNDIQWLSLLDHIPAAIQGYQTDGTVIYWNRANESVYGYAADEALGKKLSDLIIPPELHERFRHSLKVGKTLKSSGEFAPSGELELLRKDGSRVNVYSTHTAVCPPEGSPILFCLDIDLSDRKMMEEALRRNERRIKSIFMSVPSGIGVVVDRILTEVNDRLCEMVGYSREELIHQNAQILYPSREHYEFVGREKYAQIKERGTGTVETRWKRKDGRIIDVLLSSTPIDLTDYNQGVTFCALDITDRKRTAEELRSVAREWQTTFDAVSDPIWILDPEFRVVRSNYATEKFLGKHRDEILGMRCWEIVHGTDSPPQVCPVLKLHKTLQRETLILPIENRWYQVTVDPILNDDGKLT